jgi:type I restriction enzyme S subunit
MSDIPGWQTKRLDEIGQIFSGSTPSTTVKRFWDGDIIWVTPYDLARIKTPYLDDSNKRITEAGLESCSANLLHPGSLVISSRAPIGYLALPIVEFCTNQGCKSIKLKPQFDSEFTYYNVLFNVENIKGLGEGTTFAEISKAALSTVEFDFPESKPEQAKIAEVLSTVDRAIEQTEALIAKQQRIKAGLLQDLLTRGIDEHGNLRSEATHAFKDSPLGRIPAEWEVSQSGSKLDIIDPQPDHRTPPAVTDGFPYIGISDVDKAGNIAFTNARNVSLYAFQRQLSSFSIYPGAFLFGKIGTIGQPTRIPHERFFALSANVVLVTTSSIDSAGYAFWYCQSDHILRQVSDATNSTSQPALGIQKIRKFLLAWPTSGTERVEISSRLECADLAIKTNETEKEKLKALKTALMQDLLTGKKRVTPLLATEVAA